MTSGTLQEQIRQTRNDFSDIDEKFAAILLFDQSTGLINRVAVGRRASNQNNEVLALQNAGNEHRCYSDDLDLVHAIAMWDELSRKSNQLVLKVISAGWNPVCLDKIERNNDFAFAEFIYWDGRFFIDQFAFVIKYVGIEVCDVLANELGGLTGNPMEQPVDGRPPAIEIDPEVEQLLQKLRPSKGKNLIKAVANGIHGYDSLLKELCASDPNRSNKTILFHEMKKQANKQLETIGKKIYKDKITGRTQIMAISKTKKPKKSGTKSLKK